MSTDTIELLAVNKRYRREYLFDVMEMERKERRKPVLDIENTYPEVVRDACSIHAKRICESTQRATNRKVPADTSSLLVIYQYSITLLWREVLLVVRTIRLHHRRIRSELEKKRRIGDHFCS